MVGEGGIGAQTLKPFRVGQGVEGSMNFSRYI